MSGSNVFDIHTAKLWKDENFNLLAQSSPGNPLAPTIGTLPGTSIDIALFAASGITEVSSVFELNHDYIEGTVIKPHWHWYPINANAGNVRLSFEYWASRNGVTKTGILSATSAASEVSYGGVYAALGEIDLEEIAIIGTQMHFRAYRDGDNAADTYGSNIASATLGVHYLTNSRGSRQEAIK